MTESAIQTMPEPASSDNTQTPSSDQVTNKMDSHKTLIIVLTLITTIITSIVAGLQADANIRANTANRDSQYYAILASGEVQRQGLQSNYDIATLTGQSQLSQESLILQITALDLKDKNDSASQAAAELIMLGAQARADKLKTFSIFYTDPRYAPASADDIPNMESYLTDSFAKANELTALQNNASDEFRRWDGKADAYVSILTVMAMAFFLFGLAQALKGQMRLVFAIFGSVILLGSSLWAVVTVLA
jgi:hypothetical protein